MNRHFLLLATSMGMMPACAVAQEANPVAVLRPSPARGLLKDSESFAMICKADSGASKRLLEAGTATIWIPTSFSATNAKTLLKFYDADIQFAGDSAPMRIGKAVVTGEENTTGKSRFGDLNKRSKDDDFPTTFNRNGKLFEIQSKSPLPFARNRSGGYGLSFKKAFDLLIETVPSDTSPREVAWAGKCTIQDPQKKS